MTVAVEMDRGVCIISLNRPERHNAIDDATGAAYGAAFREAVGRKDVSVILLRGEGPSFCSGRDTAQLGRRVEGESDFSFVRRHQDARLAQVDCPKPVIAALKGNVLGGGLEMALAADIRIAATDVQMAFPEIGYGLMTDTGGAAFATVLAGPSRAKLMLMTGRRIGGEQALSWGLVDELVAPEDLDATALSLAHEIAQHAELALGSIKQVVDELWHTALHTGIRAELLAQVALFSSPEYLELKQKRQEAAR